MSIVELVNPRTRMITIVGTNGVYYAVENNETKGVPPPGEWITVWSQTVLFGHDRAHRAGGYAFRHAASVQADRATFEAARP
jgi:hypothetical protein